MRSQRKNATVKERMNTFIQLSDHLNTCTKDTVYTYAINFECKNYTMKCLRLFCYQHLLNKALKFFCYNLHQDNLEIYFKCLNLHIPYDPAIPFLEIYPTE